MSGLPIRRFGRTELRVSCIGLGCASLGHRDRTDEEAIAAVHRAIELGINFIDTSPLYGESERRLGLALQDGWRDKVYLETKTGTHPERRGDYSAEATRWSVENSLRLLRTDYFDAVLIHDPRDIDIPLAPGQALDELLKMKDEGLLRFIGIGVRNSEFHHKAIETGVIDIVLTYLDYTLLDQSIAHTTLPLAVERDVAVILGSVLGMGRLTGQEPEPDTRAHAMWQWCRDRGLDIRHLALQFCLALEIDGIVMPGPGRVQHVEEVVRAATTPIPDEVWDEFERIFGIRPYRRLDEVPGPQ